MLESPIHFDYHESIRSGWLKIFHNGFYFWLDKVLSAGIVLLIMSVFWMPYLQNHPHPFLFEGNNRILIMLLIALSLLGLYLLYRVIFERKLFRLGTCSDMNKLRKALYEYANKYEYEGKMLHTGAFALVDDYRMSSWHHKNKRYYIFLFDENKIWYCSVKTRRKGTFPSLVHHWIIRRGVKKIIRRLNY